MSNVFTTIFEKLTSQKGLSTMSSIALGVIAALGFKKLVEGKKAFEVNDMIDDAANAAITGIINLFGTSSIFGTVAAMLPGVSGAGNYIADMIVPWEDKTTELTDAQVNGAAAGIGVIVALFAMFVASRNGIVSQNIQERYGGLFA